MKKVAFLMAFFCTISISAQNYLISFAATGASNTVNSVKVENLRAGTFKDLNGNDVLRLTGTTDINSSLAEKSTELLIYPNPVANSSTLEICSPVSGDAEISIHEISGKKVFQDKSFLEKGIQEFHLSGIDKGFYVISIKGKTYQFSGKLLSTENSYGKPDIEVISRNVQSNSIDKSEFENKGNMITVDMEFKTGDRLKFTGISGTYTTILTDIPASDKTITFNFETCIDAGNKQYPVVNIGPLVWMAENLAYLPSVSPSYEGSGTTPFYYVYDYQGTSVTEAKATSNYNTYGVLYNWNAAVNACPTGWRLPSDAEVLALTDYLKVNGFHYDGSFEGGRAAKSLASTSLWLSSDTEGAVGNTDFPGKRNLTGFNAVPGGFRSNDYGFNGIGQQANWWTSTESGSTNAYGWFLYNYAIDCFRNTPYKERAESVRCVKNN